MEIRIISLSPRNLTTFLCIFLTGSAGMMYQITWQRYLSRLLGGDAAATAVVLAIFLGGLSAGYGLFGKISSRIRRPERGYALAEAFIGLWGLAFPVLFSLVQSASSGLSLASPWFLIIQGVLLAAVLIGPPTLCMGATIPLLTQAFSSNLESSGRVHALIYGVNTAGAFLGAVGAGYFAVPSLGLPGTLKLCASLNLLAAGWFAFAPISYFSVSSVHSHPRADVIGEARGGLVFALMALALLNGFQTMALENVLVRLVSLSLGSSAYTFTMVVGVFVLAIALGVFGAARPWKNIAKVLWLNQVLLGLSLFAVYPSIDTWPYWAHRLRILFPPDSGGFWGFQMACFALLFLVAAIPAAFAGAAVPLIFIRLRRDLKGVGRLSGRILSVNTLGNLSGSLVAGMLLYPLLNNGQIFLLCLTLAFAGAWFAAHDLGLTRRIICGLVFIFLFALIPASPFYHPERFMVGTFRLHYPMAYSYEPPEIFYSEFLDSVTTLFLEDGPEASAAVVRTPQLPWSNEAPLAILINGKSDSSAVADMSTLKMLAHLPALLAGDRSQAMVIGLGTGVTSGELALYQDVIAIDTAEISSSVIKALPLFSAFTREVQKDSRHVILHGDAFRVMARSDKVWNIIVSEPSNPWVLGVDALFSREFYQLVRRHLADKGIFVQWIHIHDASAAMLGSVLTTLGTEFPNLRLFMSQANDLVVLGSVHPITDSALESAAHTLATNSQVRDSLEKSGINSLAMILAREIALPSITGHLELLDHPKLHYISGKSYFVGESLTRAQLLSGENRETTGSGLLARYLAMRSQGSVDEKEVQAILNSLVDRRGEDEIALPIREAVAKRLDRIQARE